MHVLESVYGKHPPDDPHVLPPLFFFPRERDSLSQKHCLHLWWNIAFQLTGKSFISKGWTECYLKIHSSWLTWRTERIPKKEYSLGIYHLIFIWINFSLLQELVSEFCSSETEKEVLIAMFDCAILPPLPKLSTWLYWQGRGGLILADTCAVIDYTRNVDILLISFIILYTSCLCCLILILP